MLQALSLNSATRTAWVLLVAIMTLAPPLTTVLYGRDVDALDFLGAVEPSSLAANIGRLSTALILLLSATVILFSPSMRLSSSRAQRLSRWLLWSLLLFFVGHTVLPGFFGAVPTLDLAAWYAVLVLLAAYYARSLPSELFLSTMKISLLLVMIGGFIVAWFYPYMALQYKDPELRLPFVEFRYWGIGSNPNNIAPLSLLLILLVIYSPFKSWLLNLVAFAAGGVTLLLAQSQTTWAAALLVLLPFILYSKLPKPIRKARINPLAAIVVLLGMASGLVLLVWQLAHLDVTSLYDASLKVESGGFGSGPDQENFTGRVVIWEAAMDTWASYPWFGYGLEAWGLEFRQQVGLPLAFNAHNQLMQSVSVAGNIGLITLLLYLLVMIICALKSARSMQGLTIVLVTIVIVRGLTEGPLDTNTLLSGEMVFHMVVIYVLALGLRKPVTRSARVRQRRQRTRRSGRSNRVAIATSSR